MKCHLQETPNGLALVLDGTNWRPLIVDFSQGIIRYRFNHLQGRNELIAKAIGWKKGLSLQVFDTTAGLAQEAFLIAALGNHVTLFERNPILSALLKDGLARSNKDPALGSIIERMTLLETCAIQYLKSHCFTVRPDVIYCDPMFEPRTKSSLVKKQMQMLQVLIGHDLDAKELVCEAMKIAQKRVVVKRALTSDPIVENPQLVFKAKSHRFDVYLCNVNK